MRKILSKTFFLISAIAATTPLAVAGEIVEIDKMHMLALPRPAGTIIVGDPGIADVSVFSDTRIFLLGRGYGLTNLLILDNHGSVILDTDVTVKGSSNRDNVMLHNVGDGRETYHCAPDCLPSPKLGDSAGFSREFTSSEPLIRNSAATSTRTTVLADSSSNSSRANGARD